MADTGPQDGFRKRKSEKDDLPDPGAAEIKKMNLEESAEEKTDPLDSPDEDRTCLLDLSDDVLLYILQYCPPHDLKALGFTCERLGALILDRTLWNNVEAVSSPVGALRLEWFVTHGLHGGTQRVSLCGYAKEASGCLGRVNRKRPKNDEEDKKTDLLKEKPDLSSHKPGSSNHKPDSSEQRPDSSDQKPGSSKQKQNLCNHGKSHNRSGLKPSTIEMLDKALEKSRMMRQEKTVATSTEVPKVNGVGNEAGPSTSKGVGDVSGADDTAVPSTSKDEPKVDADASVNDMADPEDRPRLAALPVEEDMARGAHANIRLFLNNPPQPRVVYHRRNNVTWVDVDGGETFKMSDGSCLGPQWTLTVPILQVLRSKCPRLTELRLNYCNINCIVTTLSQFPPTLKLLSLQGSRCYNMPLNRSYMFQIQDVLPLLETLELSECDWLDPASLLPLSKLRHLKILLMKNCRRLSECVAYASLAARYGFRKLKVLDLRGTPLGDSEVSALGWLQELEELYLGPSAPPEPLDQHSHYKDDPIVSTTNLDDWELKEPPYYTSVSKAKFDTTNLTAEPIASTSSTIKVRHAPGAVPEDYGFEEIHVDEESSLMRNRGPEVALRRNAACLNLYNHLLEDNLEQNHADIPPTPSIHIRLGRDSPSPAEANAQQEDDMSDGSDQESPPEPKKARFDNDDTCKCQQGSADQSVNKASTSGTDSVTTDDPASSDEWSTRNNTTSKSNESSSSSNSAARDRKVYLFRRGQRPVLRRRRASDSELRQEPEEDDRRDWPERIINRRMPDEIPDEAANVPVEERPFNDMIANERLPVNEAPNENEANDDVPDPNPQEMRDGRVHVIYVNVRRPRQEMFRMQLENARPALGSIREREERNEHPMDLRQNMFIVPPEDLGGEYVNDRGQVYHLMRMPFVQNIFYSSSQVAHLDGSSLITDSAIHRFGRSEGRDMMNYVHIGPNGAIRPGYPPPTGFDRPNKSKLTILVCKGFRGITNRSLTHLATAAPALRQLDVTETKVTKQGVDSFKNVRPDCEVLFTDM